MGNNKLSKEIVYANNKKVGTMITCPICHKTFKKKQYSQAFCCSHCKDVYHNSSKSQNNYNRERFYEPTPYWDPYWYGEESMDDIDF